MENDQKGGAGSCLELVSWLLQFSVFCGDGHRDVQTSHWVCSGNKVQNGDCGVYRVLHQERQLHGFSCPERCIGLLPDQHSSRIEKPPLRPQRNSVPVQGVFCLSTATQVSKIILS